MSEALGTAGTFGLLLPPDYDSSTRRYPVIVLLHGSGQQHSTWGRRTLLDGTREAIVVMPDTGSTRYVLGDGRVDPRYERFIVDELIGDIDSHYRTIASRDGRAIGGLSIGGFGAMLLGLRHPDRFRAIGAFSAPYEAIGDPARLLVDAAGPPPIIYMGCGTFDPLLASSRRFSALLDTGHIEHRYEEGPGAHTWEAWDWQLRSFLAMLNQSRFGERQ
jgi:S-formylglutathione hydrolase FrmB